MSWIQINHTTVKVHIFWEGHKILRNLHQLFDWQYIGQINQLVGISQNFVAFSEHMNFISFFFSWMGSRKSILVFNTEKCILKGYKNEKNLTIFFWRYWEISNTLGDLFQILWLSKNIWTLIINLSVWHNYRTILG